MQSKNNIRTIRIVSGIAASSIAAVIALSGAAFASAANAPTVTSISPTSGPTAGGTSVTITGSGFTGATAVDFGTTPAMITATTSDTSITATSPATSTAGVEDVTVVTPNGTSAMSAADQFTYVGAVTTDAATGITSSDATLNAMNGSQAATGHSFWVSTSTFSTANPAVLPSGVYSTPDLGAIGANAGFSAQLSSATGIPAITPNTTYYFAAWSDVGGTWTPGAIMSFTTSASSTPSAPTITSVSPATGSTAGGTSVTITGTGFNGVSGVDFGTTPATITASSSDTSLMVTAPATSTAGVEDITVMTPNGTSTTSAADQFTYTTPVIVTAPTISDIDVTNIGTSTATITWNTDSNATGQVFYGTSASYGSMSAEDTTPSMTHSITLSGLSEATLYHFDVVSGDAAGNATSSDMVFTSGSTASTTPLTLTGVTAVQSNATADGTFADGWQWVLHFIVPTDETYFSMKFNDFTSASSSSTIPAANDIEYYSPESSNASSSSSAILESGNGFGSDMTLTGGISSTTPGRMVDVYVNVAVPSGTPTGSYSTTFGAMSTTTP